MQIEALTRKSSLLAMLLLLMLVVATLLRSRLAPFEVEVATSPFFERTISYILSALLILAGGLIIGRVFLQSGLNKGFSTLPIPIYGVCLCGISLSPDILEYSLSSLLFAIAVLLLMRSLNNTYEKNSIFFGSLCLGVLPLLAPQSVILVVILPVMMITFTLSPRQIILMVVGYILPLLATSYVAWYCGTEPLAVAEGVWSEIVKNETYRLQTIPFAGAAMVVYMVLLLFGGALYGVVKRDAMFLLSRVRHSLSTVIFILCATVAMLFLPSANISLFAFVAVPMTILLSHVLSLLPRTISTVAYWLLLCLTILHLFVA